MDQYDDAYFARYAEQANTAIGRRLMAARVDLVNSFYEGELVDVGIGSGAFIECANDFQKPGRTFGYDVNPAGVRWLVDRGLYRDPYSDPVDAISCWDVLEHMHNPEVLLRQVRRKVFVSIPIFDGPEHVMRSKHYRKDEHMWYFTDSGLERFFNACGFRRSYSSDIETKIGREGIGTYVFDRVVSFDAPGVRALPVVLP